MPVHPIGGGGDGTITSLTAGAGVVLTPNPITSSGIIATDGSAGDVSGPGSSTSHALTTYADSTGKVLEAISTITTGANSTLTSGTGVDFILQSQGANNVTLSAGSTGSVILNSNNSITANAPIQSSSGFDLSLLGGDDPTAPGDVLITAGSATGIGDGADIQLYAGLGSGGGVAGQITVNTAMTSIADFNITTPNNNDITLTTSGTGILSLLSDVPIRLNALAMGAVNGQILIGNTAAPFSLATLTAGANITITSGAGSISIASSGGSPGFPSVDYNGTARVITTADRATAIWFDDTSPSSSKTATLDYAPVFGETGLYIYNSAGNQNGLTVLLGGGITAALEPPMPVIPPGGYAIITEGANGAGFPIFSVAIVSNVGSVLSTVVNGITANTQLLANNPANRVRIRNVLINTVSAIIGATAINIQDSSNVVYATIPVSALVPGVLADLSNTTYMDSTNYGALITNKAISAVFVGSISGGRVNIDLEYVLA